MAKRKSKIHSIPMKKGRKNVPALFSKVSPEQLGIGAAWYKRLASKLKKTGHLPKKTIEKLNNIKSSNNNALELKDGTKSNVIVPKTVIDSLKPRKGKDYIWVKFTIASAGRQYFQSFVMSAKDRKDISKRINAYIAAAIKKYDSYSVFVYGITCQLI